MGSETTTTQVSVGSLPPPATSTTARLVDRATIEPALKELAFPADCESKLPEMHDPLLPVLYVLCGTANDLPQPVARPLLGSVNVERSVQWLVWGTTAEERAQGLHTGFDFLSEDERRQIEVGASTDADGVVSLDFTRNGEPWTPRSHASTSAQLFAFIDPLYATVFQFYDVSGIEFVSPCWGEMDCTTPFYRAAWESMVLGNQGRYVTFGCGLRGAWYDPNCGSSLPPCGDNLMFLSGSEGATGSIVYTVALSSVVPCFLDVTALAEVISEQEVSGSPTVRQIRGVVDDAGFHTLDGSQPAWVTGNWCQEAEGQVVVQLGDQTFRFEAGGRCDAPEASPFLGSFAPKPEIVEGFRRISP